MRDTSSIYAGRQVDVELLRGVADGSPQANESMISLVEAPLSPKSRVPYAVSPAKLVTGIEKMVQRYSALLLTSLGSARFEPERGGEFLHQLATGRISDASTLQGQVAEASEAAVAAMKAEDDDVETYGEMAPDDRIESAEILDVVIYGDTARVGVELVSAAGRGYTFTIPVSTSGG